MSKLPIGKLDSDILQTAVIEQIRYRRPEIKTGAGIGEDCACIDFGAYDCVVSTDPITADIADIGRLSIHISCNDIASNGIQPLGITLAVMLPYGTTEEDVRMIMQQAAAAAEQCQVQIVGGHTEITEAVRQPVIVSTAFGRAASGASASAADMFPGCRVLMTKKAGLEGTGIIATDKAAELAGSLTEAELAHARSMLDQVSVVPEGVIAGPIGTCGMHDVTEGGIYGAIWEMCHISGLGALIEESAIPVDPVTRKVCEPFGIDPLRLISSGCMLIVAAPDKAPKILAALTEAGIQVTDIGEIRPAADGICAVRPDGLHAEIEPPYADELYKAV